MSDAAQFNSINTHFLGWADPAAEESFLCPFARERRVLSRALPRQELRDVPPGPADKIALPLCFLLARDAGFLARLHHLPDCHLSALQPLQEEERNRSTIIGFLPLKTIYSLTEAQNKLI